jgi:serine phosphatase RsbU (regulator of sigma subunit)
MNPYESVKNWFIGDALAATDDIFEKGKIELLFKFSVMFLLMNLGFVYATQHSPSFQQVFSILGFVLILMVLIILKITRNVFWASIAYIISHSIQNFGYLIIANGVISGEAIPFIILYVSFGFLLLGRKWAKLLYIIAVGIVCIGIYNVGSGYKLFFFEAGTTLKEPPQPFLLIPLVLNVYLLQEFFKIRGKAEKQIAEQREEIDKSHEELAMQNKDIVASINYASRIQHAMLPTEENILRGVPLSFLLYKPRDIVCGDFYWFHEIDRDNYIMICADCTGHGVPGALMTMIGNSILNQVIVDGKITEPANILTELDKRISETLKQQKQHTDLVQDSMDLALLKVNKKYKEFTFCGAKRPVIYIHNKELTEFKGNKFTLGGLSEVKNFEETKHTYTQDDVIYLFTDGFADQFGGSESKKFMIKQFRELLLKIHVLPMHEQKAALETALASWKQNNEQTDDVLVIGIKF